MDNNINISFSLTLIYFFDIDFDIIAFFLLSEEDVGY